MIINKSQISFAFFPLFFLTSAYAQNLSDLDLSGMAVDRAKLDVFIEKPQDKISEKIAVERAKLSIANPGNNLMIISPDPLAPLRTPVTNDTVTRNNIDTFLGEARQAPAIGLNGYISSDRVLNGVLIGRTEIVALAGIDTGEYGTGGDCTGVLIDSEHIVTARHCICGPGGIGKQKVYLPFRGPTGESSPIDANFIAAYSGNEAENDPDPCPVDQNLHTVRKSAFIGNKGKDIALFRLATPATDRDPRFKAPELVIYPTGAPKPSLGLIAGYGVTEVDNNHRPVWGSARMGLMATLASTSASCSGISDCISNIEFVSITANGNDSCAGDSGGPFYLVEQGSIAQLKEKWIDNSLTTAAEKLRRVNPEELGKDLTNIPVRLFGFVSRGISGDICGYGGVYTGITNSILRWMMNNGARPNVDDKFKYYSEAKI